ncbi:MAG: hypothetical protein ABW321_31205 [Polyangiales bacterium]
MANPERDRSQRPDKPSLTDLDVPSFSRRPAVPSNRPTLPLPSSIPPASPAPFPDEQLVSETRPLSHTPAAAPASAPANDNASANIVSETRPSTRPLGSTEEVIAQMRELTLPAIDDLRASHETLPLSGDQERLSDPDTLTVEALDTRLVALTDADSLPDSDALALTDSSPSVLAPQAPAEPDTSTRTATHVTQEIWFDETLSIPGAAGVPVDPRLRLGWRFKAAFTGWKALLPLCTSPTDRAKLVNAMRSYERLLRSTGPAPRTSNKQISDALHAQLTDAQVTECDRALLELETSLLAADESVSHEAFRSYIGRQREQPRQLLRYARLLASRRFGIGYRRDRFEELVVALLTARLPSGKLLLMQRRRAGQVLQQLLRGLHRPPVRSQEQQAGISYLREALDRLESIGSAKQFFETGFYLDVYGYKISMFDRVTHPEFLYLCVALDVEVHNRLQVWSHTADGKAPTGGSLAALQLQLRAQQEAAQAVFADFHRPLAGSAPPRAISAPATKRAQPSREPQRTAAAPESPWLRFGAACVFVLAALGANLYVMGVLRFDQRPEVLPHTELLQLSPLLQTGQVTPDGKRFSGSLARPAWHRLTPRERTAEAVRFAAALKRRGIDHAEVLAYKTRALQVDYGTVVYVDDAP